MVCCPLVTVVAIVQNTGSCCLLRSGGAYHLAITCCLVLNFCSASSAVAHLRVTQHTVRVLEVQPGCFISLDSQNIVLIKFIYVLPESRNKNIQADGLGQTRKTVPNKIENVMPNSLNEQKSGIPLTSFVYPCNKPSGADN